MFSSTRLYIDQEDMRWDKRNIIFIKINAIDGWHFIF
jgi:hypothetical protein